jgi:1-phosphofructokinase family hexose kinase
MILVAGFNTGVDRLLEVDTLRCGGVLRARRASKAPGGKGLHVALCVAALGEAVCLVGLTDDLHREWLESFLAARGVCFAAVSTKGEIRTCIALREADGRITEVLEPGPDLSAEETDALAERLEAAAAGALVAVLSGSLPGGVPSDTYARLLDSLARAGVPGLLDASGEALRAGCDAQPLLVKPNRDEATALLGMPVASEADARVAVRAIARRGPKRVVLSLGADGAVVLWDDRLARVRVPRVEARNATGSGDCLLGGIAVALARGLSADDALRLGAACGAANALTSGTGFMRAEDAYALLPGVGIEWLS